MVKDNKKLLQKLQCEINNFKLQITEFVFIHMPKKNDRTIWCIWLDNLLTQLKMLVFTIIIITTLIFFFCNSFLAVTEKKPGDNNSSISTPENCEHTKVKWIHNITGISRDNSYIKYHSLCALQLWPFWILQQHIKLCLYVCVTIYNNKVELFPSPLFQQVSNQESFMNLKITLK